MCSVFSAPPNICAIACVIPAALIPGTTLDVRPAKGSSYLIIFGLKLGNIIYEYNNDYLNNTVLEQNITGGLKLSFPKSIDLIVSTDKDQHER